jgi:3-phenylpropionate/trans-cinnamate dioxygenase ferredoxin reductase component
MPHALRSLAVVGCSLAGLRAAEALRQDGYDGRLVMVGEEPHLPYDRPPLSKQLLAGEWSTEQIALRDRARLDELDAEWLLGTRALQLDLGARRVELSDGVSLSFDGLVVATGASPRSIPGIGTPLGVHTLRTVEDSLALSRALEPGARLVVIGAGFIGSEVAATARSRGTDVTVVEALPAPLSRVLGADMGEVCAGLHRDNGVSVLTGTGVSGIEGGDRVSGVRLSDERVVPADVVLVGVGVAPRTDWLEGSGLALADGVVCDSSCFAGPGVVAAGDVARWHHPRLSRDTRVEHWTNATEQGATAAHNLLVGHERAEAYSPVPFFWSDQYGVRIQYVGWSAPDDELQIVHGDPRERRFVAVYGREGRLTGALAFSRPRQLMTYRRLLAEGASFDEALAVEW